MPYVKVGGLKELALRGKDAESIKVVVHPHHTSLGENEEGQEASQQPISKEERMTRALTTTTIFQAIFKLTTPKLRRLSNPALSAFTT